MTYIYIGLYFIVLAYIALKTTHKETAEEYLDSGKSLTSFQTTWTTFASLLTGYNFVIGVTFSYLYGFWFLFAFLGLLLAFTTLYFLFKKYLVFYQKNNYFFSIGDYFGERFSESLKLLVNIILSVSLLLFLTLQFSVNTKLLVSLLNISPFVALLMTSGIVCVYLWFGGFKASVSTDIFQGLLMLPIILSVLYIPNYITISNFSSGFEYSSFTLALGLAVLQFLSLLGQAESFQRIFSTKNTDNLKKGLLVASVLLIAVAGSIAYIGVNYKISGTSIDPSALFTQGLLPSLPQWLRSLLTVSLIAAFMGTIDSSAFAFGTIISNLKWNNKLKENIKTVRLFMVISIVTASTCSLYLMSFLAAVFSLISLVSIIGGSVLLIFIKNISAVDMYIYYSLAIITFILWTIFKVGNENPIISSVPIIVGFIGVAFYKIYKKYSKIKS